MSVTKEKDASCPRCNQKINEDLNPGIIAKCPNKDCKAILAPVFNEKGAFQTIVDTGDEYDDTGNSAKNIDWYNIDLRKIDWSNDKNLKEILNNEAYQIGGNIESVKEKGIEEDELESGNYGYSKNTLGTYAFLLISAQLLWYVYYVLWQLLSRVFPSMYYIEFFNSILSKTISVIILLVNIGVPIAMVLNIKKKGTKLFVIIGAIILFIINILQTLNLFNIYSLGY